MRRQCAQRVSHRVLDRRGQCSGIVVPSCPNYAGDTTLTGVQALTPTISHEIVEAATDPFTTYVAGLLRRRRAPRHLERRDQRRRDRRSVRERDAGPDHARRHRLPGAAGLVERGGQGRDRSVRAGPARRGLLHRRADAAESGAGQRDGKQFSRAGAERDAWARRRPSASACSASGTSSTQWEVGALEFHSGQRLGAAPDGPGRTDRSDAPVERCAQRRRVRAVSPDHRVGQRERRALLGRRD